MKLFTRRAVSKRRALLWAIAASGAMIAAATISSSLAFAAPPAGFIQKRFSGTLRTGGRKSIRILCRLSDQALRPGTVLSNGTWRLLSLSRELGLFTFRSRQSILNAAQSWCAANTLPPGSPNASPTPRGPSPTPSDSPVPGQVRIVHTFDLAPEENFNVDPFASKNISWDGSEGYGPTYDFASVKTYELGIVALWSMDSLGGSTASDSSGNGFSGLVKNGSLVAGKFGKALALASGGGLDTTGSPISSRSPMEGVSFGAWIYPKSLSGRIVERAYDDFSLRFDSPSGGARLVCRIRKSSSEFIEASASAGSNLLNKWSHVLCTLDPFAKELRLYIDGVQVGSAPTDLASFATTWTNEFALGNRVAGVRSFDPELFAGLIDEAAVWDRALSDEDALLLAQSSVPLIPRAEAKIESTRAAPSESFRDAAISWLADDDQGAMYISTDSGQSWSPVRNGQALSESGSGDSLPARSITYKYVFFSEGKLRSVSLDFTTGVVERSLSTNTVGINLAEVSDYGTDLVFKDAFKTAREWMTRSSGGYEWDSGLAAEMPSRPDGYPAYIPFTASNGSRQTAHTIVIYNGAKRPTGAYSFRFEGQGQIDISVSGPGGGNYFFSEPGNYLINYPSSAGSVFLRILASKSADPIRNIRLIYPRYAAESNAMLDSAPFAAEFLDSLRGAKALRFMDWMRTNNQTAYSWANRTTASSYTQAGSRGMALEHMIELANALNADPWFSIPHLADENFMQRFAEHVRDHLSAGKRAYIEFSNELWNDGFAQAQYAASQTGGRARWVAERAAAMFRIFQNVLGQGRIVKVIAGQAAGADYNAEILSWSRNTAINPSQVQADALAIAPYIGNSIPNAAADVDGELSLTSDGFLDRLEAAMKTDFIGFIDSNLALASQNGIRLITYEGGHHLAPIAGEENNEALVSRLIEANRNPRMRRIYSDMLAIWAERVGDLFTIFTSTGEYTKWNMWGLKDSWDEGIGDAPKYRAVRDAFDLNLKADGAQSLCGNSIAEPGEECDGDDFSQSLFPTGSGAKNLSRYFSAGPLACSDDCRVTTDAAIPISNCGLNTASWDDDSWTESKIAGHNTKLVVGGIKCLHEFLDIEIYEDRASSDRLAGRLRLRFDEDALAVGRWLTSLTGSASTPANFYFVAKLSSSPSASLKSGNLLICGLGGCP